MLKRALGFASVLFLSSFAQAQYTETPLMVRPPQFQGAVANGGQVTTGYARVIPASQTASVAAVAAAQKPALNVTVRQEVTTATTSYSTAAPAETPTELVASLRMGAYQPFPLRSRTGSAYQPALVSPVQLASVVIVRPLSTF